MATTQQSIIVGIFQDNAAAEQAVAELKRAGFDRDQIEFAGHGAAKSGGMLSGLKSLFTGQDTVTNSVYDDLAGMGMPQEDAHYYQSEYEAGRSIIIVTDESRLQEASAILTRYGAYGANKQATQAADHGSTTKAAPTSTGARETLADTEKGQKMQLREEQLRVYKRPVQAGEVRLGKEVVTERRTLNVPVTHEEVYIERHPFSGQVSDAPVGEDETIRVPVSEEQVNVSKQTKVTGEVAVGKRQVQETQQVRDTVQREEAHIDRKGDVSIHGTDTDHFHPGQVDPEVEDLLEDH